MNKLATKNNKTHKGELAYINIFSLRFLGRTFDQIAEETGYSSQYLRTLFMKGGKLHNPWKEFEEKAREISMEESYAVLFSSLPDVVRAMVNTSKLPFDMAAVVAGKTLMEYGLGKPQENVNLKATVGIVNFSDWAAAQAELLKQNGKPDSTPTRISEESKGIPESGMA